VLGSIVAIGLAESSAESKSGRHPDSHSGTVLDLPIS